MPSENQATPRLGAHMSIAGGVYRALERGARIGCEAIQIFLKNNTQWRSPAWDAETVRRFHQTRGVMTVFAHSSYLINLGVPSPRSVAALVDEIHRAETLGVPLIVMHPGSHLGAGENAGLKSVAHNLDAVFAATPESPVRIALETTAGQGTCLGHRFEHLAAILRSSNHPNRLAVCVDSCHLFAAGYDIRARCGYEAVMQQLEEVIGWQRVVAFHLNDSKKPLGSRVDRHAHIGKGFLGLVAFRCILQDARWRGLPMVLETPKSADLHEDAENLRVLRELL